MEFFVIDHDNFYSCVKCNEMFLCESEVGIGFAMTKTRNWWGQEHKNLHIKAKCMYERSELVFILQKLKCFYGNNVFFSLLTQGLYNYVHNCKMTISL